MNGGCQAVVVDNGSTDGSELACDRFPDVELLSLGNNLGFAKACNLGARNSDADFFLFLNPDAVIYPGTLEKALTYMESQNNANAGICGVQLVDDTGDIARSCTRFPRPLSFVALAIGIDRLLPQLGHAMREWPHDTTQLVDHVIGAFFLVRRELFIHLGGFDERFFVYFEDLDFSYRARLAGWRSVYLADVQAFHAGGGTSYQVKSKRLFYSLRSRILYAFKHFSLFGALLVLLPILLIEPFSRCIYSIVRRSGSSFLETLRGYAMLIRWLPQWLFKGVTR